MPSVSLTVTPRAGILSQRLHISRKFFFHRLVAPPLYYFQRNGMAILRQGPPKGGVECKGGMKNHDFRPMPRFISEMMQDRTIVTIEGE